MIGAEDRRAAPPSDPAAPLTAAALAFAEATTNLPKLAERVATCLADALADVCVVDTVSASGLTFRGAACRRGSEILLSPEKVLSPRPRANESIAHATAQTGQATFSAHASAADFAVLGAGRHGSVRAMAIPFHCRGKVVGVATLLRLDPGSAFCAADYDSVRALAEHAGLALGNALALEAAQQAEAAAEQAAQTLRDVGTRFTKLSESGIVGIVVGELSGRIVEVNDAIVRLLGYSREDLLSGAVPWATLTPPELREVDVRAVAQLRSHGVGELREKEYIRKDGTRVPVLIGSAVVVEAETPLAVSFVLDLTERKQAQGAVERLAAERATGAVFQAVLQSAPDAMVIVAEDGTIALTNNQLQTLFGYDHDELVGQPIEMLVPERYRSAHPGHRGRYVAEGTVRPMGAGRELFGRHKSGREFPIEVSLSPVRTEGRVLVSSAIRDVTERKNAEAQRARLAAIVESTDDAIIGKSLSGIITSWNEGAHRLFGYSAEEIVGKSILVLVPPGREAEVEAALRAVGQGAVQHFDTVRRKKDGRIVHVSVTISPVRDVSGRIVGISKVARDVTERRRAEEALARAKEAAEAASLELEAFSYSVAHDLRAPLRAMNGFAQVLSNRYEAQLDARAQDWLQEILGNSKKMGALIDSLLALSRINRSELKRARVDLTALARSICSGLSASDSKRKARFVIEDNLSAFLDPTLGEALLENLLGNAWKFTSKTTDPVIELGAATEHEPGTFFVRDNGVGFNMAYASKLFGAFQRLHSADEFPGTGIGLATVQRIVRRHGGRVWAEGSVGVGATFFFSFSSRTAENSP